MKKLKSEGLSKLLNIKQLVRTWTQICLNAKLFQIKANYQFSWLKNAIDCEIEGEHLGKKESKH